MVNVILILLFVYMHIYANILKGEKWKNRQKGNGNTYGKRVG